MQRNISKVFSYLLRIPAALRCSLYLSFTDIVASIPRESSRQPAILFLAFLVICNVLEVVQNTKNAGLKIRYELFVLPRVSTMA